MSYIRTRISGGEGLRPSTAHRRLRRCLGIPDVRELAPCAATAADPTAQPAPGRIDLPVVSTRRRRDLFAVLVALRHITTPVVARAESLGSSRQACTRPRHASGRGRATHRLRLLGREPFATGDTGVPGRLLLVADVRSVVPSRREVQVTAHDRLYGLFGTPL